MKNDSLIQIGGPEKGQCGMRAEASSYHNYHGGPALPYLSSLSPKPQWGRELPYHYFELVVSVSDISPSTVGDLCLD